MKRQDLLTNEDFFPSRINQKFANSENRIKYYNDKANKFRHSIAYLNKPIQQNIKILNELVKDKNEAIFHKQFLLGKGFSLGVYTHIEQYDGKNHFAIHTYIILPITNEQIKIIKYN
jgi:hypothetical protein